MNSFLMLLVNHKSSRVEEPAKPAENRPNGSIQRGNLSPCIFPIHWLRFLYIRTQNSAAGFLRTGQPFYRFPRLRPGALRSFLG